MSDIIRNAIQTPDGTVLHSRSVHDYKSHIDLITSNEYIVDGGHSYIRTSTHADQISLCVVLEDGHEAVREALEWGTYGISGDQPLSYIKLKDMEDEHIQAVLGNCGNILPQFKTAMQDELVYRGIEL